MEEVQENFERLFRKVEEESDRRAAWEQRRRDRPSKDDRDELVVDIMETKDMRRRSVPTSHLAALSDGLTDSIYVDGREVRRLSVIRRQFARRSFESLDSSRWQLEEIDTLGQLRPTSPAVVTRRPSTMSRAVGQLIPRRFGRSRSLSSADILSTQSHASRLVIDVSVEKTTSTNPNQPVPPPSVAGPTLKSKKSKSSLTSPDSLVYRITQRVRKKSKSVLNNFTC